MYSTLNRIFFPFESASRQACLVKVSIKQQHYPSTRYAIDNQTQALLVLLLFPGLDAPFLPPFIFLTLYLDTSAEDAASLLFAKRFLPPNPNFSSFFARLGLGLPGPDFALRSARSFFAVVPASSSATSKRLSSFALPMSAPWRSSDGGVSNSLCMHDACQGTYFS